MTERKVCLKCGREGHHSASCKQRKYGSPLSKTHEEGVMNAYGAIKASPAGLRSVEVAFAIGLGISSAQRNLRILRDRGLVVCPIQGGRKALWMIPEHAPAALAAHASEKARMDAEYTERRTARRRKDAELARSDDECDPPIVKISIDARLKRPPYTNAVRSVFELARV